MRKLTNRIGLNSYKKEKNINRETLYCFSPPIMLATFIIEMLLAVYVYIKSIKAKSDVGIVLVLVFLAVFQLSEYQICEGTHTLFWTRIGLFAITFLPVLGLYLISKLNRESKMLKVGFLISIIFAIVFVFAPNAVTGATCGGNYIMFDIDAGVGTMYGMYYFGFLILGIWEAAKGVKSEENKAKIKSALRWFIIGYLSFILPLTVVYIFIPATRVAVASIMCGFAVIFAFILAFKIAPIYHECIKAEPKKKVE